ncbi:MAG: hypothetical protein KF784_14265 [Fimbriimonadaceae bacterium]|nr:hypothetical protein [Fimbriimonadaceae bacterium]
MIAAIALFSVLATAQNQTGGAKDVAQIPKGMIDGAKLKADFNADREKVRLMFIFSPS